MIDTRFATALQIVIGIVIAERENGRSTSVSLAQSLDADASFVRKLLKTLSNSGLIESSIGYQGGVRLARPASEIKISEIYSAVTVDKKLWGTRTDIPRICLVTENIGDLSDILSVKAEQAIIDSLQALSVEDSIDMLHQIQQQKLSRIQKAV